MKNKEDFILEVLSLFPNVYFSPVQIQKLFFLIEKKLSLNEKYFEFIPYHYGPYDKDLKNTLLKLKFEGKLIIDNINNILHYKINDSVDITKSILDKKQEEYIRHLGEFIRTISFKDLCMAIYKEYPEMAINSAFFKE